MLMHDTEPFKREFFMNKNSISFITVGILFSIVAVVLLLMYKGNIPFLTQKKTGLVVINVLDKQWYDDCHIKGSINVPLEAIETYAQQLDPEASEIVLYCSNYFCTSSGYACKLLKNKGFKHVWAYEGGTAEWYQLGFPVEGPCEQEYLKKKIEQSQEADVSSECDTITAQALLAKLSGE